MVLSKAMTRVLSELRPVRGLRNLGSGYLKPWFESTCCTISPAPSSNDVV